MIVPIFDARAQYQNLKAELDVAIRRVLESGTYIMGPNVRTFEAEIADYLGVPHAISLNSGTDALHLALRALDIGPHDEVITSPFTFAATAEAIGIVGAVPVFVDIDPATLNIDADLIEAAITPRTKAILPIHLYGIPANIRKIASLAQRHRLSVVEDCAQAIGAKQDNRMLGTWGIVGCFSFFPTKNLGACGDGGLITTNDGALAERLRALRAHGGRKKYYHEELGINSRLDELQAAILRVKLKYLDSWINARRNIAARYTEGLNGSWLSLPKEPESAFGVFHQYTIRSKRRNEIRDRLAEAGIQTMVYYPLPLHQQPLYDSKFKGQRFPQAESAADEVLSLPIYPELDLSDVDFVVRTLKNVLQAQVSA